MHARLQELLESRGARLGRILHCPHDKGMCACRKPGTLMLEQARDHLGLQTLDRCVMIGDSDSDVLAGSAAGSRSVLLRTERGSAPEGVERAASLLDAVRLVLVSKCIQPRQPGARPGAHGGSRTSAALGARSSPPAAALMGKRAREGKIADGRSRQHGKGAP